MNSPIHHNEIFSLAFELVNYTDKHVFLTGKAGTGKTTFLKYLKENTHKNVAIVAPTGVAAINAGGTTLHSFLQLPFGLFIPEGQRPFGLDSKEEINDRQSLVRKLRFSPNRRKVINALELLIIDEISMVRADLLDMVDTVLRFIRKRPQLPFGGVQVLFIGDMFQLPPVVKEEDKPIIAVYYKSPFFFDAKVIQQAPPQYVELKHVYRQRDEIFLNVLNEVRNNELSPEGLRLLEERYFPGFKPNKKENFITLATHNFMADQINAAELEAINGRPFVYEAIIKNDFPEFSFPVERIIKLKLGSQVMFIKNDTETPRRFFNGKIGVVTDLDNDKIVVTCKGESEPIRVAQEEWKNIRYSYDANTRTVTEEELGSFVQYPLRLAWAITIHKSQGLTFEKAIIDAGRAFEAGQVYVALSRCTSLEGMILRSPINAGIVLTHERIAQFGKKDRPVSELEQRTKDGKRVYLHRKIRDVFDFSELCIKVATLQQHFQEFSDIFNKSMEGWLNKLQENILKAQDMGRAIGESLHPLLDNATDFETNEALQEFLKTNAKDFHSYIQDSIWLQWRRMPGLQTGHTRRSAESFYTEVELMNEWLKERIAQLERLIPGFSLQTFFNRRFTANASLPLLQKTFGERQKEVESATTPANSLPTAQLMDEELPNRKLYKQLRKLTNEIIEREDVPAYYVATNSTLVELCKGLPTNLEDIVFIKGFGNKKAEKYGSEFLAIIDAYCKEHNLATQMDAYKEMYAKRERKPKPSIELGQATPTRAVSFRLFQELKSIAAVAKERGLAESTVGGHLAQAIAEGKLDVFLLTTQEVIDRVLQVSSDYNEGMGLGVIKERLGDEIGYPEIKWAMAWKKWKERENTN